MAGWMFRPRPYLGRADLAVVTQVLINHGALCKAVFNDF